MVLAWPFVGPSEAGDGFLIGLVSSLMGISGGSLATMVLTSYSQSVHKAVATSAGIGVPITIAGTVGYELAGLPPQTALPPLSLRFVSLIGVVMTVMAGLDPWALPRGYFGPSMLSYLRGTTKTVPICRPRQADYPDQCRNSRRHRPDSPGSDRRIPS